MSCFAKLLCWAEFIVAFKAFNAKAMINLTLTQNFCENSKHYACLSKMDENF